jgi:hypothetical protein
VADSPIDQLNANLDALVADAVAKQLRKFVYAGLWEYTVTGFDEGSQTASLSPVASDLLSELTNIPISLPALQSKLHEGMTVTVAFANNDPDKPRIVNLDFASTYDGALPVGRQGDMTSSPVTLIGLSTLMTTAAAGLASPPLTPVGAAFTVLATALTGAYALVRVPPPPPPFVPELGGMTSIYGVVSSGSTVNKSK